MLYLSPKYKKVTSGTRVAYSCIDFMDHFGFYYFATKPIFTISNVGKPTGTKTKNIVDARTSGFCYSCYGFCRYVKVWEQILEELNFVTLALPLPFVLPPLIGDRTESDKPTGARALRGRTVSKMRFPFSPFFTIEYGSILDRTTNWK